jgi:hypothetical protein
VGPLASPLVFAGTILGVGGPRSVPGYEPEQAQGVGPGAHVACRVGLIPRDRVRGHSGTGPADQLAELEQSLVFCESNRGY